MDRLPGARWCRRLYEPLASAARSCPRPTPWTAVRLPALRGVTLPPRQLVSSRRGALDKPHDTDDLARALAGTAFRPTGSHLRRLAEQLAPMPLPQETVSQSKTEPPAVGAEPTGIRATTACTDWIQCDRAACGQWQQIDFAPGSESAVFWRMLAQGIPWYCVKCRPQ